MTNQATASHSYTEIAESAYKSYIASIQGQNFNNDTMAAWGELPPFIQTAWEAAARQVANIAIDPFEPIPDEQTWNGWSRP